MGFKNGRIPAVSKAHLLEFYSSSYRESTVVHTRRKSSEYLDMLLSLGFMPIITKPTTITDHTGTVIDHTYKNTPEELIKSGLCLADISDHLPVFYTMATHCLQIMNQGFFETLDILMKMPFTKIYLQLTSRA